MTNQLVREIKDKDGKSIHVIEVESNKVEGLPKLRKGMTYGPARVMDTSGLKEGESPAPPLRD